MALAPGCEVKLLDSFNFFFHSGVRIGGEEWKQSEEGHFEEGDEKEKEKEIHRTQVDSISRRAARKQGGAPSLYYRVRRMEHRLCCLFIYCKIMSRSVL